ncbi:hypothetical protein DFA_05027 [Cavenderia fasciculata]|uniref:Large ribosomal subunit protein mL52 n=1 Tax=Cavenderia fasciculata TaxID=261658 RepID=F4PN04_CACFS|nr:uncharacterized protein DFA_05027 [Cavenderia fasciculata]EGG22897.1 hypothetical protein DFA_05027 [Cavenderia fasciculata]|eukprot:XP_004360748.1 hypothetical protein DFA_05027 [Cavenderia fasciculata]
MNIIVRRSQLVRNTASLLRAGENYRLMTGQERSGNAAGPLHDLPDFHFADGRPAPVTHTQMKWQQFRSNTDNILNRMMDEVKVDQSQVTSRIDNMQTYIDQKITQSKEKRAQKKVVFEKTDN